MSGLSAGIAWALAAALVATLAAAAIAGAPPGPLAAAALAGGGVAATAWIVLRRRVEARVDALRRAVDSLAAPDAPEPRQGSEEAAGHAPLDEALARLGRRLDERVAAHAAERARLAAVIESMAEGVLAVDRSERVLLANASLRTLLAVPGPGLGAQLVEWVRHPDLLGAVRDALARAEPVVREVDLGDAAGRAVRVLAAPFPRGGPPAGVVALVRDVTEARHVERIRRDFVANASHELKTPLSAIRGYAERLAERDLGDPAAKRAAEAVLSNTHRLTSLVEDLLDLSRAESGRLELALVPVDVAATARALLADLSDRAEAAGLELALDAQEGVIAHADPRAVAQVLGNLLDNAVQYTDPGGRITVRIRAGSGRVHVDVADTGIGIPARDLPRIFERFYRVDPARSRAQGGTGLGLAIVRHLVAALGGEVAVESRPGQGSTFTVWLPAGAEGVATATRRHTG